MLKENNVTILVWYHVIRETLLKYPYETNCVNFEKNSNNCLYKYYMSILLDKNYSSNINLIHNSCPRSCITEYIVSETAYKISAVSTRLKQIEK